MVQIVKVTIKGLPGTTVQPGRFEKEEHLIATVAGIGIVGHENEVLSALKHSQNIVSIRVQPKSATTERNL